MPDSYAVRSRLVIAALVALPLVAACGGAGTSPATSAAASTGASGGAPEVSLTPPPGGVAQGTLTVRAQNISFDPVELHAPTGQVLVITLDNKDSGIPHDLRISDAGGRELGKTDIITGPMRAQVQVGPLEPGSYPFACEVHPNMTGTLVVDP